jgi:hypothetical protein
VKASLLLAAAGFVVALSAQAAPADRVAVAAQAQSPAYSLLIVSELDDDDGEETAQNNPMYND